MPKIKMLKGYSRFDLIKLLSKEKNIGIELGVAGGDYSAKLVESKKFSLVWGVDMYADTHNTKQYKDALLKVGLNENYKLLRMTFNDALDLFPDSYFDFIYFDGYAADGFEGGKTLRKWAKKVKLGGVIAGDDYHEDFGLLQRIIDEFVDQNSLELFVTEGAFDFSAYSHYPSWAVVKNKEFFGQTSFELQKEGASASRKTKRNKLFAEFTDLILRKFVSVKIYNLLREWNRRRRDSRHNRRQKK